LTPLRNIRRYTSNFEHARPVLYKKLRYHLKQ
jgi:hypothetical protein